MKFRLYIKAPESISAAYFPIPPISLCVYMYNHLLMLDNGSVKTLARPRIHMQQQNIYWTRRFLYDSFRIKGESVDLFVYCQFYYLYRRCGGVKAPRAWVPWNSELNIAVPAKLNGIGLNCVYPNSC
jgi:hypothetical protein